MTFTRERFAVAVLLAAAAFWLGGGFWAFLAPQSFYDQVATFPPYNEHFLHDAGAFQIGLGSVLLAGLWMRNKLQAVLLGVGIGSVFHLVAHVIDDDLGGRSSDPVGLGLLAALTLAAAWAAGARETT
jgi:hypothetical protein